VILDNLYAQRKVEPKYFGYRQRGKDDNRLQKWTNHVGQVR
jgi:hypothetical protein